MQTVVRGMFVAYDLVLLVPFVQYAGSVKPAYRGRAVIRSPGAFRRIMRT